MKDSPIVMIADATTIVKSGKNTDRKNNEDVHGESLTGSQLVNLQLKQVNAKQNYLAADCLKTQLYELMKYLTNLHVNTWVYIWMDV